MPATKVCSHGVTVNLLAVALLAVAVSADTPAARADHHDGGDERPVDDGLTIEGSGTTTVQTADHYVSGAAYAVSGHGADPVAVTADADGRLWFTLDLDRRTSTIRTAPSSVSPGPPRPAPTG